MTQHKFIQKYPNSENSFKMDYDTIHQNIDNSSFSGFAKQKDFAMFMLKKSYMISSIKKYISDTELFLKWSKSENLCVEDITYNNMLRYILHIKPDVKQKTIACKINSIKHYFNFLIAGGKINQNPTSEIKVKGVKNKILYDLLSMKELEDLYFSIVNNRLKPTKFKTRFKPEALVSIRNKVILGLMIFQGFSTREIEDLALSDILLKEGKIIIRGNARSNQRILKLESFQVIEFNEYLKTIRKKIILVSRKTHINKVFVSMGSGKTITNLAKKLLQNLAKINAKISSFRQIRSSVIANWLKKYNLRHVQYMVGHRYVSSTETYLNNQTDTLFADIHRFHPIV